MLNIAVVGCGYWGPNHVRNFNNLTDCAVTRVCDLDSKRLAHITKLYGTITPTNDYDELLTDSSVDAVVISTPVSLHYSMAKKALKSGKHVLIEKPMTKTSAEAIELIELARKKNLKLMVGHTFIYNPVVSKIKEIIADGALGDILYISSRRLNLGLFQSDINVAWDLAPHDISIILHLMEKYPESVNCQGKGNIREDIEDITNMTLNFDGRGFATIQSSWLDPNKVREMTIVGSRRMLVYNDMESMEKIKIFDKRVENPPYYDTFADFHFSYHYGDVYAPYVKQIETLQIQCQHFIDCILKDHDPQSSGLHGLQVVRILEAATASLRNGGAKVDLAEERMLAAVGA
ncbi:Gfo/Idh/MocA family protein [Oceanidesulfovibrio marinus]|uniref:Gfo/Idh/MocA family oxidoreductase n=1 Tax=Oceanidesulfovibrio marinus TaxID=370038 RepID=A0A6P1ZCV7_9BACT|nr:Gfo/Idh/MocA family oxidoreductase [Oceanidesulfovibrio marinus]TVM32089.1 gfo/Idh/MocA family oxidoreductase [Oceanidesulfovibrio marinus]